MIYVIFMNPTDQFATMPNLLFNGYILLKLNDRSPQIFVFTIFLPTLHQRLVSRVCFAFLFPNHEKKPKS